MSMKMEQPKLKRNPVKTRSQELYDKFPKLFRQQDLSMQETCMCWGIACGDGWFDIINEACEKLTALANEYNATIEFGQVKEKFGGLRLYIDITYEGNNEKQIVIDVISPTGEVTTLTKTPKEVVWQKAHEITSHAEELSYKTCEVCGKPGVTRNGSWISTLCDEHAKKD